MRTDGSPCESGCGPKLEPISQHREEKMRMTLRNYLLPAVAAMAMTLAAPATAQDKDVTIGVAGSSSQIALLALNVARTKGFITDEGVNLEVIDFGSGSKGVQAFVAGEVDFVAATFEHSIRLNSKGIPARSVVSLSKAPGIVMGVTKSFESDFKEMKDLVGKAVGVSAPGSASHTFLKLILSKSGVNPEDVGAVGVGNAAGAVAAVRTGSEIQATVGYDPVMTMLETSGDIKVIVDLRDTEETKKMLGTDFTFLSLIANKEYVDSNPEAVQAVVNGVVKALKWIPTVSPEEVLAAVPEEFWKENKDLYLESIKKNLSGLSTDGQVTQSEAEGVYEALLTEDDQVDPSKVNFADTFDNSFAEKANAN